MSAAGPPTPPPTSAVEIADEARAAALEAAASSTAVPPADAESAPAAVIEQDVTPAPTDSAAPGTTETTEAAPAEPSATDTMIQDDSSQPTPSTGSSTVSEFITQHIIPSIIVASADKKWQEVIRLAEDAEIHARTFADKTHLAVPLLLAYLIEDELPPARYAIRRLPLSVQSHPVVALLSALVEATESRKYANVYSHSKELLEMEKAHGESSAENATMATIASSMIIVFQETFRLRVFTLLSKAYSSLPLTLAENYIGLPAEQIIHAAQLYGWTYDSSTQIFYPKLSKRAASTLASTLSTIDFVANSVAKLEL